MALRLGAPACPLRPYFCILVEIFPVHRKYRSYCSFKAEFGKPDIKFSVRLFLVLVLVL